MPTIKHVGVHVDDMHDGRPMVPYRTYDLTSEELATDHYQSRLRDGSLIEIPAEEPPATANDSNETVTSTVDPEADAPVSDDGLDALKTADLRDRAVDAGLNPPKNATKPTLIQALRQHAANQETDHDAA